MTLKGTVKQAPAGAKGFDVNMPVPPKSARAFKAKGYDFVARYVGRRTMKPFDLTAQEAQGILDAGLALMIVQHVEAPGWHPTGALGTEYGANAAKFTRAIGVPMGVTVWCDLECVAAETKAADVIAFCNAWYSEVARAGYTPGLYVGDTPGLTGPQIYKALKFEAYWGAYNVNGDEAPLPRGWQIKQHTGTSGTVGGFTQDLYDDNTTRDDGKGGRVIWLAPA